MFKFDTEMCINFVVGLLRRVDNEYCPLVTCVVGKAGTKIICKEFCGVLGFEKEIHVTVLRIGDHKP